METADLSQDAGALSLKPDRLLEDVARLCRLFTGPLTAKDGTPFLLMCRPHDTLPNLVKLKIFSQDSEKSVGFADVLLLPQVREIDIGYVNLAPIAGRGLAGLLAHRFGSLLPSDCRLTLKIQEVRTRDRLVQLTQGLMAEGKIEDWRLHSPARPEVPNGKILEYPEESCRILEREFLMLEKEVPSPLGRLARSIGFTWQELLVGINDRGQFLFEAYLNRQS